MNSVSIPAALAAGTLSFLSPCVFPLVPGYLSFLTGSAAGQQGGRARAILLATCFTLGFGLIFVLLGATASGLGRLLGEHRRWLEIAGGAMVLLFGVHLLGLRISLFFKEARFHNLRGPKGPLGAILVGAAFGFGWSPCVGPLLGGVLTLAAAEGTIGQGVLLLVAYATGLALPFIAAAAAIDRFLVASARIRPILPWVERAGGALLAGFGLLLLTDNVGYLAQLLPGFEALAL